MKGLEALPFEMLGAWPQEGAGAGAKDLEELDHDGEGSEGSAWEDDESAAGSLSDESLQFLNEKLEELPPLERALTRQALGLETVQLGKELAVRFACSPARVSQVKASLMARWELTNWPSSHA